MADKAVSLEASNLFAIHANFNTASSSTETSYENAQAMDELGNVACQVNVGGTIRYTQGGITYCGSDFVADLGTILTQFGKVSGVGIIESISISCSAGQYATMDITGHNHVENAHTAALAQGYADMSDFLPHEVGEAFNGWDGFGVPSFGITLGTNATPSGANITFSMTHVDSNDETGAHWVGKNITPSATLTMDFEGLPTSVTAAAVQVDLRANTNNMLDALCDSVSASDSNNAFDTFSFAAHANASLATA